MAFGFLITNTLVSTPHEVALTSQWECIPIDSVVYRFFSCLYVSNALIIHFLNSLKSSYMSIMKYNHIQSVAPSISHLNHLPPNFILTLGGAGAFGFGFLFWYH